MIFRLCITVFILTVASFKTFAAQPDLQASDFVTIGKQVWGWNGPKTLEIDASQFRFLKGQDRCAIPIKFAIYNKGIADTETKVVSNAVAHSNVGNTMIYQASLGPLKANSKQNVSKIAKLKNGTHKIQLVVDLGNVVKESDETNNVVKASVRVKNCGGISDVAPAPQTPQKNQSRAKRSEIPLNLDRAR